MTDLVVKIARRENGKFIAASTAASPYFCFEADSEEEVKRIVDAAHNFYQQAKVELSKTKVEQHETSITAIMYFT